MQDQVAAAGFVYVIDCLETDDCNKHIHALATVITLRKRLLLPASSEHELEMHKILLHQASLVLRYLVHGEVDKEAATSELRTLVADWQVALFATMEVGCWLLEATLRTSLSPAAHASSYAFC
ncbi:hypothetical protein WJX81_005151 [Elliptochloris bilobata]|uniref:Uncharacterized protein n=1 Tax=Elliptochloris bilobata TaxID=381761 RepID=A0AAW1QDC3_9CHLO